MAIEANARAKLFSLEEGSTEYQEVSSQVTTMEILNAAFLAFYAMESALRVAVQRIEFFKHSWNNFDFGVVLIGIVDLILEATFRANLMPQTELLRILRTARAIRAIRFLIGFKELYALICGITSCLKTLIWAAFLLIIMITWWSIFAIEFLHPLAVELDDKGYYETCYWCRDAFSSIHHSNLTFFQIISGDGWSVLSRPILESYPLAGLLIIMVIFTMAFGMLNLITAVIVDTAAQAREEDVMHIAAEKRSTSETAWKRFEIMCKDLDKDNSGDLVREELEDGMSQNPKLRANLDVMGVQQDDIHFVFDMLDHDKDGKVTYDEFAQRLHKMKTQEVQTTLAFIKHYIIDIRKELKNLQETTFLPSCKTVEMPPEKSIEGNLVEESHRLLQDDGTEGLVEQGQGLVPDDETERLMSIPYDSPNGNQMHDRMSMEMTPESSPNVYLPIQVATPMEQAAASAKPAASSGNWCCEPVPMQPMVSVKGYRNNTLPLRPSEQTSAWRADGYRGQCSSRENEISS
eukprot:gnl/MRDRNA2_/MRDRNA2_34753_c0_seq1.p1 gnl/MRDRNA2_/MRDRNA2_34753_c0~~gnl/MRDRNA2_/MRDRNA2_34753_c0_seq1.p1  ORF type:complete len:589 (-),score=103.64 gnl/MRDRNA2_/MRDRNA2_34753_c0_seq1:290-1846(-)